MITRTCTFTAPRAFGVCRSGDAAVRVERTAATLQREFQNDLLSVRRRRDITDDNPCEFFKRAATGVE